MPITEKDTWGDIGGLQQHNRTSPLLGGAGMVGVMMTFFHLTQNRRTVVELWRKSPSSSTKSSWLKYYHKVYDEVSAKSVKRIWKRDFSRQEPGIIHLGTWVSKVTLSHCKIPLKPLSTPLSLRSNVMLVMSNQLWRCNYF